MITPLAAPTQAHGQAPPDGPVAPGTATRSRWLVDGPYPAPGAYTDRETKAAYVAAKYAALLGHGRRVLDVGCDTGRLRSLVGDPQRYVGVDVSPGADVVVDLDCEDLPFEDARFDTVVCTDVLEHLERCHAVFDELCRVSRDAVIVSLPNPLLNLVQSLYDGKAGRLKYYGLPLDAPKDRHRWFFGFEEAAEFLTVRGRRSGMRVEQLDAEPAASYYWRVGKDQRDALESLNVRAGTCWCVLRRGLAP